MKDLCSTVQSLRVELVFLLSMSNFRGMPMMIEKYIDIVDALFPSIALAGTWRGNVLQGCE